jgi:hypothetical protein
LKPAKQNAIDLDAAEGLIVSELSELIELADTILELEDFTRYTFELDKSFTGPSGLSILFIKVADGRVIYAKIFQPEY